MSLEARNRLNEIEKDDFFFRGLKPQTFRSHVKHELKAQKLWTDLTVPPTMDDVIIVAKALLKHDLYYDDSNDESEDDSDEEKLDVRSDPSLDNSDDGWTQNSLTTRITIMVFIDAILKALGRLSGREKVE